MSYQYDIFLSYPRLAKTIEQWVLEVFRPMFVDYLKCELGRMPNVFIDKIDIKIGDSWPDRLKYALSRSRCMVAIWSPPYFTSEWCCREFAAMRHRARKLGIMSTGKPYGIVLPIKVWDGDSFPSSIKDTHWLDLSDYVYIGKAFEDSNNYHTFQKTLRDKIPEVAELVESIPESKWRKIWSTSEWLDIPIDDIHKPIPKINRPRMI